MIGPSGAGLVHGVRVDRVDRIDQRIGDVREHDLVPALAQQQTDESAPDVARAEMDGCAPGPARALSQSIVYYSKKPGG